jgi:hypothetical protein
MTLNLNPAIITQLQAMCLTYSLIKGLLFYETELFSPISYRKTH